MLHTPQIVDYIGWGLHVFLFVLALPGIVQHYADNRQARAVEMRAGGIVTEIKLK